MVTKCVCSDVPFSEIKKTADTYGFRSINELKEYINFGNNCRFCYPYIELMFTTDKTEFEPIEITGEKE